MKSLPLVSRSLVIAFIFFSFILTGCASRGGKTYSDSEVRQVQTILYGVVVGVNEVDVDEDPSGGGAVVGGVAGGVLGSLLGGGSGHVIGALGGAAVGALAGTAVEKGVKSYKASEITVDLNNNGGTVVIVQGNDEVFAKGDKVDILTTKAGRSRVRHSHR